ncbi:hypothetical protein KGM_209170 [Danaus plexippus plexippus]|uniref:Uncharacterized protein n=1 Tax=Danaus plexippus plexippus TaxID=278856 RepID=A0A212EQ82_DANPL|nr:hypothetical protein KGM_209170 [Danaus plexippus plexippus]
MAFLQAGASWYGDVLGVGERVWGVSPAPAQLAWPTRLSHALRNACIIIMTDADRAAAPLICGAFDLTAEPVPLPLPNKRAACLLPLFGRTPRDEPALRPRSK